SRGIGTEIGPGPACSRASPKSTASNRRKHCRTPRKALDLWRELGDASGEAEALETLGWLHDEFGNYEAARRAHEQSFDVRRENGMPEIDGWLAMAGLCHLFVSSGEIASAESMASDLRELG